MKKKKPARKCERKNRVKKISGKMNEKHIKSHRIIKWKCLAG